MDMPRFTGTLAWLGVGSMWVVSLTYGIAIMAVTSALAFGMIWSVEKLAQRGIRHD